MFKKVPKSKLASYFSRRNEKKWAWYNNRVFIDRDGQAFTHVINFLRNNLKISTFNNPFEEDQFYLELEYWKLNDFENSET